MLPDRPSLVKCPHCKTLIWIGEQKQVGEVDPFASIPRAQRGDSAVSRFAGARRYLLPTASDYFGLLTKGIANKPKRRYVHMRAWWVGNDRRRKGDSEMPMSQREIENLRQFGLLLDERDETDRLMKAETLRESGKFAEAAVLLKHDFGENIRKAAGTIRNLTKRRIAAVQRMQR